ncbi:DUF5615 family PIN-like protein [Candidatus Woesearchaeota archaeon]|nr:DUF5615 family PIN-like protein [Candidatus Woesearchaeota archaeon]
MSSSKPKLLSDENIPNKLVELLLNEGFDVKKAPRGAGDKELADLSNSEGRVILSFDKHFGNILLFPPEEYKGIVFIRIHPPLIRSVFSSLINLFDKVKASEFKGKLFTLSSFDFRIFPKTPPKLK